MTAALVIFAVFAGLSCCIATVAGAILLASGKFTLPHTNMRRVQNAKVELEIVQMALERERVRTMLDAQIDMRLQHLLPKGENRG